MTLEQLLPLFRDGQTHTLRALAQRFLCEKDEVLQHLTRRNGFSSRIVGKQEVWGYNPLLAEIEAHEQEVVMP